MAKNCRKSPGKDYEYNKPINLTYHVQMNAFSVLKTVERQLKSIRTRRLMRNLKRAQVKKKMMTMKRMMMTMNLERMRTLRRAVAQSQKKIKKRKALIERLEIIRSTRAVLIPSFLRKVNTSGYGD